MPFWEAGVQFLVLNSCWQIDRFDRKRSGVHLEAVANAIKQDWSHGGGEDFLGATASFVRDTSAAHGGAPRARCRAISQAAAASRPNP